MKKKEFKDTLKVISFVLVFLIILESISLLAFSNKAVTGFKNKLQDAYSFVNEPDYSIQIVGVGNSDLYSGFSPYDLWINNGYTSTICASARQDIQQSTYLLKKVLKNQNPKLVIIETDMLYDNNPKKSNRSKSSGNLSDFINGLNPDYFDSDIKNIFSIFQFHNKWKSLDEATQIDSKYNTHGYRFCNKIHKLKNIDYMVKSKDTERISIKNKAKMDKLISICKENNTKILFVEMPSVTSWNYARHNTVSEYAKEKGIDFLDFNLLYDKVDISVTTCFRDKGNHLNYKATQQVTKYIGSFIESKYNIEKINNKTISKRWNNNYRQFKREQSRNGFAPDFYEKKLFILPANSFGMSIPCGQCSLHLPHFTQAE